MTKKTITDEEIGALVRERRRGKGMSQPDLGDVLGVSGMMIQKYETGTSSLTVVKLYKIARALGCKTLDLIPHGK